ncbi:hypothetical protein FHP25_24530 [Vineibacter terrae]|uniref:Uncharacterized protein n=1 Tax=Vineibacter terrae TaxID=2586908 RepID=A0A5C8PHE4_9HYPH|nr:hypothetical protein [Vineibacter terrae]TXL72719.1 hypothetical protein FHP25_24530 [Vineibacter terrae]
MRNFTIGLSLLALGVGCVSTAHGRDRDDARFAGIGVGISHAPEDHPATFVTSPAPTAGAERSARAAKPAEGASPATARRPDAGSFSYRGLRMSPTGLDPTVYSGVLSRGDGATAVGGATPLPADLQGMPKSPGGQGNDRPSPTFSTRGNGGVLGLSYKIKPTQP